MKLLIDAGNTRLKWCWCDADGLPSTLRHAEYDALEERGAALFERGKSGVDEVLVCSVAGDDVRQLLTECFSTWNVTPRFFRSQKQSCGVLNAYASPERLGVDRWLAMIGAWSLRREAACIVDCGTAMTIDALDDSGRHLGGMIVPGLALMRDALTDPAHGILPAAPASEAAAPAAPALLARDTGSAIDAGVLYASVALIERVYADLEKELDTRLSLYLSGGDADLIAPLLSCESRAEPMLIFRGMMAVDELSGD